MLNLLVTLKQQWCLPWSVLFPINAQQMSCKDFFIYFCQVFEVLFVFGALSFYGRKKGMNPQIWASSECREPGVAVNHSRIYQPIEGGWRWRGFYLNRMLSFYITADGICLGRWANKVRWDESDYRWEADRICEFVLSSCVSRRKDSQGGGVLIQKVWPVYNAHLSVSFK